MRIILDLSVHFDSVCLYVVYLCLCLLTLTLACKCTLYTFGLYAYSQFPWVSLLLLSSNSDLDPVSEHDPTWGSNSPCFFFYFVQNVWQLTNHTEDLTIAGK